MTDYDDLCRQIRATGGPFNEEAATAIAALVLERAALREQVAEQSKAADMIAEERDAWEKRAKAREADNAALLTLIRSISYRLNGGLHDSITVAIAAECDAMLAGKEKP